MITRENELDLIKKEDKNIHDTIIKIWNTKIIAGREERYSAPIEASARKMAIKILIELHLFCPYLVNYTLDLKSLLPKES